MKTLLLITLATLFITTANAQGPIVKKLVFERTYETTLTIEENTFIRNIMGYACPVPAINLDEYTVWDRRLRHNRSANFDVEFFALSIKDPNMRFCNWQSPTEIFGETFKVGNEVKLEITVKREIVEVTRHDGKKIKQLRETISSELNGKLLISSASVDLDELTL